MLELSFFWITILLEGLLLDDELLASAALYLWDELLKLDEEPFLNGLLRESY